MIAASAASVEAFARDGAVLLKNVLTREEVRILRRGINHNLAQPSARAKVASRPDDPGHFIEDFCSWQDNDDYRRIAIDSALPRLAAALMHSNTVRLHHDHMLTKTAGTRQPTPWHQDQPYYNIDGAQTCSFWIPVDRVSRAASLDFVAGSHLGPWLMPRSFMDRQAKWFPEGHLAELPDIESDPGAHAIIGWPVEPGDAIAFHMLALHASGGARNHRRVFSLRYMGDDVRHAPRPWTTSPPFPGLDRRLPAGSVMDDRLFPIVWPR
jgi:ectoine hydroxylase-related dioxygenase (phytanoyl-CoA dioxygenase family)